MSLSISLIKKIEEFEIIKEKGISIALDEAGVANLLFQKKYINFLIKDLPL